MSDYAKIYSVIGLQNMIKNNKEKIIEKKKEYDEVEIRYNPLCADGNRREIAREIKYLENKNKELEKALEEKKSL